MKLRCFDQQELPFISWSNQRGTTQEIVCWPVNNDFSWRACLTSIDDNSSLGQFPDIERQMVLLEGKGVNLNSPGFFNHSVTTSYQPFDFSGDIHVRSELIEGAVKCLNIMVRRTCWKAETTLVTQPLILPSSHAGLIYVIEGQWTLTGATCQHISKGQGAWWLPDIREGEISPLTANSQLLWADIRPLK
ncbi:MAG TPA: HutD family protein [Proteus sp.]|uniref:HutD family protein n=1 Tax=Proteus hauseri ATCC 700826 TaxID=1354271 RepID=A0AAJ3LTI9_PROHU|nr:HutD family protein [Proteus hauseri]OAT46647.1 hypothetical protein M997_2129 [Proteus hauseri ATCC 700826]QAV24844.1 cold-shock protein [Proteus hauseri]HCH51690.1 HutD family protein [Proteus sp. (in: enterobacteria)]